jgi:hypothetical protein
VSILEYVCHNQNNKLLVPELPVFAVQSIVILVALVRLLGNNLYNGVQEFLYAPSPSTFHQLVHCHPSLANWVADLFLKS